MNLPELNDLRLEFPWCYGVTDEGLTDLAEALGKINNLTNFHLNFER